MAGMTSSRPMGGIRGKDKVNERGCPSKEVASPMGQHGKNDS